MKPWILLACGAFLTVQAAFGADSWRATRDEAGRWGVVEGERVVLPHRYDGASVLEQGRFIRACNRSTEKDAAPDDVRCGVFGPAGAPVLEMRYLGVEHLRKHRRFKVAVGSPSRPRWGFVDEAGQVVLAPTYERADRISNQGDEPTFVVSRDGKYGYVDAVAGVELIAPTYDGLDFAGLDTDVSGRGLGRAWKGGRVGIVDATGAIVVPFDYSVIDGAGRLASGVIAERPDGKLVRLTIREGRLEGAHPIPDDEGLRYELPDGRKPAQPFDGTYVTERYATYAATWRGRRNGELREVRIPNIVVGGDEAFVGFGVFAKAPLMMMTLPLKRGRDSFTIDAQLHSSTGRDTVALVFRAQRGGVFDCAACESIGVPRAWRKLEPLAPFGGVGIAIQPGADGAILVVRVLEGGPAQAAGLRVGDVIRSIANMAVNAMTADDARDALRGPEGSQVAVVVDRSGVSTTLVMKRKVIRLQ